MMPNKFLILMSSIVVLTAGCSSEGSNSQTQDPSEAEITVETPVVETPPAEPSVETPTATPVEPISSPSSAFVTLDHPTAGYAKIVKDGETQYLEFDESFKTDEGPDLVVVLHRDRQLGSSLKEGDYITLAPLEKVRGQQRYQIPEGINAEDYGAAAIWCRRFNVTFGYAKL